MPRIPQVLATEFEHVLYVLRTTKFMAPRRPSAFDVSFPGEATSASGSKPPLGQSVSSGSTSRSSPSASSSSLKRKSDAHVPGESRVRSSDWLAVGS